MRLFIAVYPPPPAVAHLQAVVAGLRVGQAQAAGVNARLASVETWHLTLAFIGEVDEDKAGRAERAVAAAVAEHALPAALAVAGGGVFGRGRFTILWAGIGGDTTGLLDLATGLRRALKKARVPYDRKPLRPHLTIARVGDRLPADDVSHDKHTLDAYAGPAWPVTRVALMRSELRPKPVYTQLFAAPS